MVNQVGALFFLETFGGPRTTPPGGVNAWFYNGFGKVWLEINAFTMVLARFGLGITRSLPFGIASRAGALSFSNRP